MDLNTEERQEEAFSSGEEEDTDERKHNQLLDAISSLDGKKKHKLSQRTVLSNQVSEFNFTASKDSEGLVNLHELIGSLKEKANHGHLKKQLRNITKQKKLVPAPLAKHEREQINRSTAYEVTSEEVSKWDPIVKKNRLAEQLHFPLQKEDFKIVTTDQLVKRFQPRTPLERQMAEMLQGSDCVIKDPEQELTPAEQRALKAMDIKEAKERRMELMKHRALLSYKEQKAKRQKKIKSKRFHKIQKKEKLKNEKKQLEKLEQEDPEGYQDKLNQIERVRAEERVSLKHRGGSKFAKKQMIYAKYDERARQEVQDMLQKSRELTKKVEIESESEDEKFPDATDVGDVDINSIRNSDNPWMARPSSGNKAPTFSRPGQITDPDIQNIDTGSDYSRPKEMVLEEIDHNDVDIGESPVVNMTEVKLDKSNSKLDDSSEESEDDVNIIDKKKGVKDFKHSGANSKEMGKQSTTKAKIKSGVKNKTDEVTEIKSNIEKKKRQGHKKKGRQMKDENNAANTENRVNQGILVKEVKDSAKDTDEEMIDDEEEQDETLNNESVSRKRTLDDLEELLQEDQPETGTSQKRMKVNMKEAKVKKVEKEAFVDPKKLFTLESKIKHAGPLPKVVENEDDDNAYDDEQQRFTIAEAFADDDVIEEFTREKEAVIESSAPKDIDLTLPGWGSWGGQGIKISKKKRSRFTIKAAPPAPRKDDHLGNVIINESYKKTVAKHMVHEIPFPFTNAQQFEKSIRAPLGKTWNPEGVHKDLVKPQVLTHLGKIIQPMDKSKISKVNKDAKESVMKRMKSENEESEKNENEKKDKKKKNKTKQLGKNDKAYELKNKGNVKKHLAQNKGNVKKHKGKGTKR